MNTLRLVAVSCLFSPRAPRHAVRRRLAILVSFVVGLTSAANVGAVTLRPGDLVGINMETVFRIDPATGDRTIISGKTIGSGPSLRQVAGLALDTNGNIFVADSLSGMGSSVIFQVDPATGDRRIVSGGGVGSEPVPDARWWPRGIAFDRDGSLLVTDWQATVFRIDIATGDRVIVSGKGVGAGRSFVEPMDIATDSDGNIFVVDDEDDDEPEMIFRVDPMTGDRIVVSDSDNSIGSGPEFKIVESIVVDANGDLLVASDITSDPGTGVLRVDPVTGDRTILTGGPVGSGPVLEGGGAIALGLDGTLFLSDYVAEAVLRVDPVTGDRAVVSNSSLGNGPQLANLFRLAVVPIPEPSALVLTACGLCVILWPLRGVRGAREVRAACRQQKGASCAGLEKGSGKVMLT